MGDVGDAFRATKEIRKQHSKQKKDRNLNYAHKKLIELGVNYTDYGFHFAVFSGDRIFDYWPTTGKWCLRNSGIYKRGINSLLKELEK